MTKTVDMYLDKLFSDFPPSKTATELRFELKGNLLAQLEDLKKEGLNDEEAFQNALKQLGDIRATLEECLGQKAINHRQRHWIALGFAASIMCIIFGLCAGAMNALQDGTPMLFFATVCPFFSLGIFLLIFLLYLKNRSFYTKSLIIRALAYGICASIAIFGLSVMGILYYETGYLWQTLAPIIPFIIPAVGLFAYLWLTEPKGGMDNA